MKTSSNQYEPLAGFYASTMYLLIVDDFGNEMITVWPILEISGSEAH